MTSPTTPIPSQAFGEVQLTQVNFYLLILINFYLLIPSSPRSSSTPLTLYSSTIMLSTLLTGAAMVFLCTCPNHLNLFSRIFPEIGVTPNLSLNSWFLIRSINVCPHIHPGIRIFVTSILCSKIFLTGQYSVPYSRAGLIAVRPSGRIFS